MIDHDGRQKTAVWTQYVAQKRLRPLDDWSPNSPDFNAIENVFAWMKRFVEDREPRFKRAAATRGHSSCLGRGSHGDDGPLHGIHARPPPARTAPPRRAHGLLDLVALPLTMTWRTDINEGREQKKE